MDNSIIAIVISIVISIASNLLTPYVSRFLDNLSASAKKRNEQKKRTLEKSIQYILENPQEETNLRVRYWGRTTVTFLIMVMSLFQMFSTNTIQIIIAFFFYIFAHYLGTKTNNQSKILDEVWKRKKAKHPEIDLD